MTGTPEEWAAENKPSCPHCGESVPCQTCAKQVEKPGVKVSNSDITVTLPVGQDKANADSLLRTRGIDPDDVEVVSVTVNQWEGLRAKSIDNIRISEPIVLHQTKVTYRPIPDPAETPWGRFLAGLNDLSPKAPLKKRGTKITKRPVLWFVHGDDQAPHINTPLHDLTLAFLDEVSPDRGVHVGDLVDFGSISRHRQKVDTIYNDTILDGLDAAHRAISERTSAAGVCEWHFLYGNHDERLMKYLVNHAPELVGIRPAVTPDDLDPTALLDVSNLLRFGELGWTAVHDERGDYPYSTLRIADELLASHGWIAAKGAGNSAAKSVERLNSGIIVGHTHRLGLSHITRWDADGEPHIYSAAECGTMADPRGLGYARDPDWQNGFVTVEVRDGAHSVDLAVYRDKTLRWRDREWRITSKGIRSA